MEEGNSAARVMQKKKASCGMSFSKKTQKVPWAGTGPVKGGIAFGERNFR